MSLAITIPEDGRKQRLHVGTLLAGKDGRVYRIVSIRGAVATLAPYHRGT